MTSQFKYQPRNDLVLIRRTPRGKVRGLHMPDSAREGFKLIVEAKGPKVEDLTVGSEVRIPGQTDLYLTREANVLAVVEERVENDDT